MSSAAAEPRRPSRALLRAAVAVVLGVTARRDPAPVVRPPWASRAGSSYEAPVGADPALLGRAAQLPPFGRGNGIDALFWTPVARVEPDRVDPVLAAFAAAGVPGWAAPAGRAAGDGAGRPHDVWAGSLRLDDAQDLLLRVLSKRADRQKGGGASG